MDSQKLHAYQDAVTLLITLAQLMKDEDWYGERWKWAADRIFTDIQDYLHTLADQLPLVNNK